MNDLDKLYVIEDPNIILSGYAYFTIESQSTGKSFTYKIIRDKVDKHQWYVRVLAGNNMQIPRQWYYVGIIKQLSNNHIGFVPDYIFRHTARSVYPTSDERYMAIEYVINELPEKAKGVNYYHHCRCARCGKMLKTPESIKAGIGVDCLRRFK